MKRCESIDPRIDYSNSAYMNMRVRREFISQIEHFHENRLQEPEKWRAYADCLPKEYIPATTFTWDQEATDSFTIDLPHKPLWYKKGRTILHSQTNQEVPHNGTMDAGWNYLTICWNPDPPLSFEEQTRLNLTSIRADDEEGIQRRFEQLRELYGTYRGENVGEEDFQHAND